MKNHQGSHGSKHKPRKNNITHNDPFTEALQLNLAPRIFDEDPGGYPNADNAIKDIDGDEPEELLIVSDSDAIVQVFAVVVKILCAPITGHTMV
jgi:hypothetical protein